MSYEPTEWVKGTKITASKLNNIEQGVQSVNSEYTPTTWSEGDIVTSTKLNNIEQGIANASGGGGGDSDFSTAEVKIKANLSEIEEFCFINPDSSKSPGVCAIPKPWELTQDGPLYKIILYKTLAVGVITPSVSPNTLQVTGDIEYEYDEEENVYIVTITGDGTISLSQQSN